MAATIEGDLDAEQVVIIADMLDVPEQDVVTMDRRLTGPDQSFNAQVCSESGSEWQDWLTDETDGPDAILAAAEELSGRKTLLAAALATLNDRERHILSERRLRDQPSALEQLSEHYGFSRERVRQIEERAFVKLKRAMKGEVPARRRAAAGSASGCQCCGGGRPDLIPTIARRYRRLARCGIPCSPL